MNVTLMGSDRPHQAALLGNTWDPTRTLMIYATMGHLPYPPATAANLVAPWNDSVQAMSRSIAEMKQAIDSFSAYQQANDTYLAAATKIYKAYIMGWMATKKAATASDELKILTQGVTAARAIFQRAANQIALLMQTKATSNMPAFTPNASAPRIADIRDVAQQGVANVSARNSNSMGTLLLIPAGILAAYFVAKG